MASFDNLYRDVLICATKMLHIWVATCQDVASLDRGASIANSYVRRLHLWVAAYQDVSSLDREFGIIYY